MSANVPKATVASSIINLSATAIGACVLVLPSTVGFAGIYYATLLLICT